MTKWLFRSWVLATGVGLIACGSDGEGADTAAPTLCQPGSQVECDCIGGIKSHQTCTADGNGFGLCECGGGTGGTGGTGTPGCTAPDCSACAECFTKCLCQGATPADCLAQCTGTGGVGGSSGSAGSSGVSG